MPAVLATSRKRRREEPLSQVEKSGLENTAVQEEQTVGWYWLAQGLVPGWTKVKVRALKGKGGFHHSDLHPP